VPEIDVSELFERVIKIELSILINVKELIRIIQ
jgi:hypothetical protein